MSDVSEHDSDSDTELVVANADVQESECQTNIELVVPNADVQESECQTNIAETTNDGNFDLFFVILYTLLHEINDALN